ncbi:hypothetical protein L6164_030616 [Bauhinia variegata]|uniref:Uncharacterized protein n=1 Tax=Bauhinia variegata TaxID=167791 RepID=A0ACB9LD11_BAUVA|nr:hypothetical protein L6164_030616 [Bauhinia variegata]
MASEELGAPADRKFDVEAWKPGLESLRSTQMIVCLLENYQQEDGSVIVPEPSCYSSKITITIDRYIHFHLGNYYAASDCGDS